jgi:hypothetical protein
MPKLLKIFLDSLAYIPAFFTALTAAISFFKRKCFRGKCEVEK